MRHHLKRILNLRRERWAIALGLLLAVVSLFAFHSSRFTFRSSPLIDNEAASMRSIPAGQAPGDKSTEGTEVHEEGGGPARRRDWFTEQRAYPLNSLPRGLRTEAYREMRRMASAQSNAETWTSIGPAPMRNSSIGQQLVDVSGRVTALAVDPRNSSVVYLGAAQGGVWKTTNDGASWKPLTDDQPSLAVGALTLDPQRADVIYVGTGEPNSGSDNYYGVGVLKSTNGGATWQQLGEDEFTGLGIAAIIVDPQNANTVYVATSAAVGAKGPQTPSRGIFKSTDGGQTWQAVYTCKDCTGASDLVMDPANPSVLYAAFWEYGIFKSTNGGENWQQLQQGLPSQNFQRVELSIAPSDPSVLYAGFEAYIPNQYSGALVYKSTNGGNTWQELDQAPNYCGEQCWYDNIIAVQPDNPNVVYLGGSANYISQPTWTVREVLVKSTDGGTTWWDMSYNDTVAHTLHPDMHAIAFDPRNPQIVWVGNDGGVWKSTDGGANWINKNTNLATLQFTGVAIHPTNAQIIYGGMQDNNKAKYTGSLTWEAMDVGDGGYAAIDPFDGRYFYGTRYNISFQRNDKGGTASEDDWPIQTGGIDLNDRSLFYPPFTTDPSSSGVLYFGTYRVYRTVNRGDWWQPISGDLTVTDRGLVSTIAVAPSAPAVIYVGTSDGQVQVTTDVGGRWTNVTKAPLPDRWVSEIAVSSSSYSTAYVVYNGFDTHTPSTPGHVFKTTNAGATWRDISSNLPDIPVVSIVLDRDAPGTIYLGTDIGVFRTTNDGQSWTAFNNGMPNVAVFDLALNPDANVLVAATHGRSVYRVQLDTEPAATSTPTLRPTSTPTLRPGVTPTTPRPPVARIVMPIVLRAFTKVKPAPTPTVGPTATRVPSPTPFEPPSPVSYSDDFHNPASGWEQSSSAACTVGYQQGEYEIRSIDICVVSAPTTQGASGMVRVDAHATGSGNEVYGLVFAGQETPMDVLIFWVDPHWQEYALYRVTSSSSTPIVDWTTSDAINIGTETNRLAAKRDSDQIHLYVNNLYLESAEDNSAPNFTMVGLAAGSVDDEWATARFDNFATTRPTVAYQDRFSDTGSGWYTDAGGDCQAAYEDAEYRVTTEPDFVCIYFAPSYPFPDGIVEVKARRGDSLYPTAYGLIFGADPAFDHFYSLWVAPDSQEYALFKYEDVWLPLVLWTESAAISGGQAENYLAVLRSGARIEVYINNVLVATGEDDSFPADGYFGLANLASEYSPATAYFDDCKVTIWDVPPWQSSASTSRPSSERPAAMHLTAPEELPGR